MCEALLSFCSPCLPFIHSPVFNMLTPSEPLFPAQFCLLSTRLRNISAWDLLVIILLKHPRPQVNHGRTNEMLLSLWN